MCLLGISARRINRVPFQPPPPSSLAPSVFSSFYVIALFLSLSLSLSPLLFLGQKSVIYFSCSLFLRSLSLLIYLLPPPPSFLLFFKGMLYKVRCCYHGMTETMFCDNDYYFKLSLHLQNCIILIIRSASKNYSDYMLYAAVKGKKNYCLKTLFYKIIGENKRKT